MNGVAAGEDSQSFSKATSLPTVFLMTNSLETGGSERQFIALAKSLTLDKFRTLSACIMRKGPSANLFPSMPEFRLGGSLYGWKSLATRARLARHLHGNQVDIAHAFDFYTNLTLIPSARLAGIPVVIGSQRQLGDLLTPMQFRTQADMFRLCDAVICNSRAAAERLAEAGIRERSLFVVGNGLDPVFFASREPLLPKCPGLIRVGMIARMNTPAKRHGLLLEAAVRVHQMLDNVEFVLAGDGPLRPELEQKARQLGIHKVVHFLGDCRDVPAVLASLDVTVLPSQSESLSNSILESMAAGVPVVATDVGGNPELVNNERGVLVPPADATALASAIVRLAKDVNYREICAVNCRNFASDNFTLDRMRQRHEEIYQELLARKQWQPRASVPARSGAQSQTVRVRLIAASLRYVGGQSVQADLLLRNWQDDPEVDVSLIPIDPLFPSVIRWVEKVPGLRTIVREPLYLLNLWRGLKDADVAHVFSASYWSFLIAPAPAWLIARMRGVKTLIHYHSGEARDHLRNSGAARSVLRKVDRVVVPSRYLVEVFDEFNLHAEPVPNVVDLSQIHYRERRPFRPYLVCTRGFHPYYCVDVVVRAFANIVREFPDARLDLFGKGPSEEEIRSVVRELEVPGVHFMGVATRNEIGAVYDRADIFINASRLDNMPVSVMEAFAAGTPVVTTSPECMPYLVEDGQTGLLSPVGDADALASNVIRLLRNQELAQKIASNAYEKSKTFRWEHVRTAWLKIYNSLMNSPVPIKAGKVQADRI